MTYNVAYAAAWLNAAVLAVATVLAAAGVGPHPSWLTSDVSATAAVIVPICGGLALILPPITRTPGAREAKYLAANAGKLPDDIAQKYPAVMPAEPPTIVR